MVQHVGTDHNSEIIEDDESTCDASYSSWVNISNVNDNRFVHNLINIIFGKYC